MVIKNYFLRQCIHKINTVNKKSRDKLLPLIFLLGLFLGLPLHIAWAIAPTLVQWYYVIYHITRAAIRVAGLFHELVFCRCAANNFSIGVALYRAVGAAAVVVWLGGAATVTRLAVCACAVGALACIAVHIGAIFSVVAMHIGLRQAA